MNEIFINFINSVEWHKKFIMFGDVGVRLLIAVSLSYAAGKIAGRIVYKTAGKYADNNIIPFIPL